MSREKTARNEEKEEEKKTQILEPSMRCKTDERLLDKE